MQPEAKLKKTILQALKLAGIFCFPVRTTGIKKPDGQWIQNKQQLGVSDILGMMPDGRFLAIEVKTEKGIVSDYQRIFLNHVIAYNGHAIVARSLDDVLSYMLDHIVEPEYKHIRDNIKKMRCK